MVASRRFGVELEFWQPSDRIWVDEHCEQLLPYGWRFDEFDTEAVSPVYFSFNGGLENITDACTALHSLGCTAGDPSERGLHVHLSRADLGIGGCRRLMARYMEELPRLNEKWPDRYRSMPGSDECNIRQSTKARTMRELADSRCDGCRPAIGPHHDGLRTIEARQHPATLDPDEIMAWVRELWGWSEP